MKSLRWVWVLGLLVGCASASGQGILIPASFYAVEGAPFTLTVETHWEMERAAGPKVGTQRILRDSLGRQRYEAPVIDGVPRSATVGIYDVVAGKYIKLDTEAKTAEVGPMRLGRTMKMDVSVASSMGPAEAAANQTLLGTKEIAGLEAWGQRTVSTMMLGGGQPDAAGSRALAIDALPDARDAGDADGSGQGDADGGGFCGGGAGCGAVSDSGGVCGA